VELVVRQALIIRDSIINANKSPFIVMVSHQVPIETSNIHKRMIETFPGVNGPLEVVLAKFRGRLFVAGGALHRAYHGGNGVMEIHDIDLFFVDPDVDQHGTHKTTEYSQWLEDAVALLISSFMANEDYPEASFIINRNRNCTTVTLDFRGGSRDFIVQFIHRVYPSVGAVIGGFDIGAAMMAWDGLQTYTTELHSQRLRSPHQCPIAHSGSGGDHQLRIKLS